MIGAGIIVVPNEILGVYLVDRTPTIVNAKKPILAADFDDSPILLIAFEHDGVGAALPKKGPTLGSERRRIDRSPETVRAIVVERADCVRIVR